MHSRRLVIFLEIYASASWMLITLRGLKQISLRYYANLRWYFLHYFLTQWSISPYIYRSRQKLEDWSSIDGCIYLNDYILQLQCSSYIKIFSLFFLFENIWLIQSKYLFHLKKKVKNKAHVEASICEAYIVKEISTFISYYFEPHLRTKINRVPQHDDGCHMSLHNVCWWFSFICLIWGVAT